MKIVADQQIPFVTEAFSQFGDVHLLPGREIQARQLKDCDILLVRSVTRVNAELLDGHNVRFVGSATSGIDHIDTAYLQSRSIGFAHAPGCNARAVAEYVLSALFELFTEEPKQLRDKRVGIVGYGHVGSRLARFLDALNIQCVINDPPLARQQQGETMFRPIEEVMECDIISLHVPLTGTGDFPTRDLINAGRIQQLRQDAILINTSRGEVLDEAALREALSDKRLQAVIDVWRHEPAVDTALLAAVRIGTPHIAGYSVDARYRAADRVYADCCRYFNERPGFVMAGPGSWSLDLPDTVIKEGEETGYLIHSVYPVRDDVLAMQKILSMNTVKERNNYFDQLRREYPARREFTSVRLPLTSLSDPQVSKLEALGFQLTLA
ncbi:MAG: 4-phosphoerythronate dehydrogenase [Thiotrichales bacterium]|nr:4-phosphoerythronate dehydrogenase [Thiotrichales bacterium]